MLVGWGKSSCVMLKQWFLIYFFCVFYLVLGLLWKCIDFLRCLITKSQILSFAYCFVIIGETILMQKQLPKQCATLKVKVRWYRKLHRNDSSVSMKAILMLMTSHVPDDRRFWRKKTYKPLWIVSRHRTHVNWLKNLVSIIRQFGIIASNLTLSTKKPRQDPHELTEAQAASRIRWMTVFGSELWHQTRSGST